jgi:hypothetical protein
MSTNFELARCGYLMPTSPVRDMQALEVFYDLASTLARDVATGRVPEGAFTDAFERMNKLKEWTDEFQALHATTNWKDRGNDYFNLVDEFYAEKLKQLIR